MFVQAGCVVQPSSVPGSDGAKEGRFVSLALLLHWVQAVPFPVRHKIRAPHMDSSMQKA